MSLLALDIGDARTGVALCRKGSASVIPYRSLDTKSELKGSSELAKILEEFEIECVIVGLPLEKDGSEGSQARHVRSLAAKLFERAHWPQSDERVRFFDERLSTQEAEARLLAYGKSSKESKSYADALAAAVILENYVSLRSES